MLPCPCVPGWEGGIFKIYFVVILLHLLVTFNFTFTLVSKILSRCWTLFLFLFGSFLCSWHLLLSSFMGSNALRAWCSRFLLLCDCLHPCYARLELSSTASALRLSGSGMLVTDTRLQFRELMKLSTTQTPIKHNNSLTTHSIATTCIPSYPQYLL